eukprot:TRINITY_DN67056_c0_g1_i1.p1 TRINITY_DN67056_c0_g1~~TRINITY_DN67056_c0_g1_i1.p1  ORF type:complete len:360 (+),score=76.38 TRINITY_DN67056_c0_g1_i1:99-1178(+)
MVIFHMLFCALALVCTAIAKEETACSAAAGPGCLPHDVIAGDEGSFVNMLQHGSKELMGAAKKIETAKLNKKKADKNDFFEQISGAASIENIQEQISAASGNSSQLADLQAQLEKLQAQFPDAEETKEQFSLVQIKNTFSKKNLQQQIHDAKAFDCAMYPKMCEAPFNCDKEDIFLDVRNTLLEGMAAKGPNLQSWCMSPGYQDYVHMCLASKDLVKAGQIQYQQTKEGKFGPHTFDLDGSYCFIEGHCLNTAVTNSTTLEEANQMCDQRYGRERWAKFGTFGISDNPIFHLPTNLSNGFDGQQNTAPYLVAACAMGNYHCDVVYCKETYCKDPYMVQKYSHFLDDLGWTKSTASWMHA